MTDAQGEAAGRLATHQSRTSNRCIADVLVDIALVGDVRVGGVQVGALGQSVGVTNGHLFDRRVVQVAVFTLAVAGQNGTCANRHRQTQTPDLQVGVLSAQGHRRTITKFLLGVISTELSHTEVIGTIDVPQLALEIAVGGDDAVAG